MYEEKFQEDVNMSIIASKGCLHIDGHKELTKELGITKITDPAVVGKIYVPVTAANGKPLTLLVNVGDEVYSLGNVSNQGLTLSKGIVSLNKVLVNN
jgi:Na+-translocating ferredoxin:NAD+ oxidoreductase RnfC subunit